MNEKADFEIIFKKCEHVTYVTARTISMIINMINNQNLLNEYLLHYSLFLKFSQHYILIGLLDGQNMVPFIKTGS